MKSKIIKLFLFSAALAAIALSSGGAIIRADELSVQGLSLSPFIFQEKLQKGQIIKRDIVLSNNSTENLHISAALTDFRANEADSAQPLLASEGGVIDSNYALSSWMSLVVPPPDTLAPGQKITVTVSIGVPVAAEEGGRYGAVLFTYAGDESAQTGSQIIKKAGTLFFVKVGTANEQGNIARFSSDRHTYTQPAVAFATKFEDTGNVHLQPKGNVSIYNMFGQLAASVQINRDAQIVMPGTSRTFESFWRPGLSFGKYTAVATMYYGDAKLEAISKISFWMFPIKQLSLTVLIMIAAVLLLWQGIKRYNRWILKKAGKR